MYYYTATDAAWQPVFCNQIKKMKMFLTMGGGYSIIIRRNKATVAQLAEQLIRNQQVAGSSPASSSNRKGYRMKSCDTLFCFPGSVTANSKNSHSRLSGFFNNMKDSSTGDASP